jgi:hypothetical protein
MASSLRCARAGARATFAFSALRTTGPFDQDQGITGFPVISHQSSLHEKEVSMKFNIPALALAIGVFWAGAILITGVANLIWPGYGQAFLQLIASVYPGYSGASSFGQVIIATLYGLVDGAIGGAVFAWLYNCLAACFRPAA